MNNADFFTSGSGQSHDFPTVLMRTQKYMAHNYYSILSDSEGGEQDRQPLLRYIRQILLEEKHTVEGLTQDALVDRLYDEMAGFFFLTLYLNFDIPGVDEININSWDDTKVHFSDGRVERAPMQFFSPSHAIDVIRRLLGKFRIILDNTLKETHRGRCGALDMRILDPACEDFPGSKINLAVESVFREWQNSEATKGTQMVFCDLSVPNGRKAFNVYDDMREKLVEKGLPREKIRFIHEASTEQQKEALFADMRRGKARILFGSTARMGTGTNVQQRMIALHHLDAPWRPANIKQRDGRILQQRNSNKAVSIFRYVTEGTFGAYSRQILEQKRGLSLR